MDWNLIGFIKASKYRMKILFALKNNKKTTKELTDMTGFYISHVSKTLKELLNKKLITCLTPNLKKGKIYSITDLGTDVLDEIEKLS